MVKTMKISELVNHLNAIKNQLGDIDVIHQEDPEGNSFGTIQKESIYVCSDGGKDRVFIFPYHEHLEIEEL